MITQFKIFEDRSWNHFELNKKFWYIEGDINYISNVLDKFMEKYDLTEDKEFYWLRGYHSGDYSNILGVYFGFEDNFDCSHHYGVMDYDDFINGKKCWRGIYQGRLEIKNDELFLNTIDIDAEKYNI